MTSVQSWLLLPSSWCEDEHSYPTPLDQGSEQPLFQPLDQQATSLPSRGERALSQGVCSSICTASCSVSLLAPVPKTSPRAPRLSTEHVKQQQGQCLLQTLCPPQSAASAVLSLHQVSLLFFFFFSGLQNVFQKSYNKTTFVFICRWSQEYQSN